jgi:anthraniloyl-CoA monooxygenase
VRIVCAGGGPAGLYFAILAKLHSARHEVTVVDRNPRGTAHGWGVTFGEDFLDDTHRSDPDSARTLRNAAILWRNQVVRIGDQPPVHLGGKYGFSMGRTRMLEILTSRASELGVQLEYERAIEDPAELDADLVVAADGAGSRLRSRDAEHFGTTVESGRNRYIWLGTSKAFDSFTFAFERTASGWIWFYTYPSSDGTSTFIVECHPETWTGLELDRLDADAGVRVLEDVFAALLDGHRLLQPQRALSTAPWQTFRQIRNTTWYRDNLVLMGDAAHTTHFGVGSGTVLAVQDAIGLAEALFTRGSDLRTALPAYDQARRTAVQPVQEMAARNMRWFEDVDPRREPDPVRFGFSLLDRRGDQAAWHYQLHRATQIHPVRQLRSTLTLTRRSMRAIRRQSRAL